MGLGVDLEVTTNTYGQDNRQWLGTSHGTQATRTITLNSDAFIAAGLAEDGNVPSGVPLVEDADGRFIPAAAAATECDGHLYSGVKVRAGASIGAALYDHGKVRVPNLPDGSVTTARAAHIIYLDA